MNESTLNNRIRKFCGMLAIELPWLAIISGALVLGKPTGWWHSISATYYITPAFAAILSAIVILFMVYDGYETIDRVIAIIAGSFALLAVLFPCQTAFIENSARVGFFQIPARVSSAIHFISEGIFFSLLAANLLFLFTKYDQTAGMTEQKKLRNKIYVVCGLLMIIITFLMLICYFLLPSWTVLIWEISALQAFGFAWLVKGGMFFLDEEDE